MRREESRDYINGLLPPLPSSYITYTPLFQVRVEYPLNLTDGKIIKILEIKLFLWQQKFVTSLIFIYCRQPL